MAYIYCFYFEAEPDQYYIGKTINPPNIRYNSHIRDMKNGKHHSYKVQEVYNKYNVLPIFSVLVECREVDLDYLEIEYIKEFDAYLNGLNCTEVIGFNSHTTKYSRIQILKVFLLLLRGTLSYESISNKAKVTIGTIKSIRRGTQHSWLKEAYPDKWETLKSRPHNVIAITNLENQGKPRAAFISPDGTIYTDIQNLKEFVYSLDFENKSSAYRMFSAMYTKSPKAKSYKGWKLYNP